jgi:preprotein translocase subunit YajC
MNPIDAAGPLLLAQVPGGAFQQFIPLVMILGVFYFLLIRPQQQRAKEHEDFVKDMKKGDRVVTQGGLFGTVHEVKEDSVLLEVAQGVKLRYQRDRIGGSADAKREA